MIRSFIKESNIRYLEDVSLRNYNTYRVSSVASMMVFPKDVSELKKVISFVRSNNIKYMVLGNGSNVIFKNDYYDGVIIKLDSFNKLEVNDNRVVVGAGYHLIKLAMEMANRGLSGLEFASGIPGAVGASVAMNVGAYNEDMAGIVKKALVLTLELEVREYLVDELDFSYRHSFFKDNREYICLEVELELQYMDKEEILEVMAKRKERRMETQPLEYPSAGSVFRNPIQIPAGKLIEDCGFKGYNINGVEVSTKHANFIINKNNGSGKDIVLLIEKIKDKVKKDYNVDLILEQEIIE